MIWQSYCTLRSKLSKVPYSDIKKTLLILTYLEKNTNQPRLACDIQERQLVSNLLKDFNIF